MRVEFKKHLWPTCSGWSTWKNFICRKKKQSWACRNRSSRIQLQQLIVTLWENGHAKVGKDVRTLLKTPRTFSSTQKYGGESTYAGIEKGVKKLYSAMELKSFLATSSWTSILMLFPFLSLLMVSYGQFLKYCTRSHHLL